MLALKGLFPNHYTFLIFFCMIQFRNYQSASFNILSLVAANFIWQRQIDPSFLRHYKHIINALISNYLNGKKTDEYELFLGSADKLNVIVNELDTKKDGCANILQYFFKVYARNYRILNELQHRDGTPHP